jgi:XisH protein
MKESPAADARSQRVGGYDPKGCVGQRMKWFRRVLWAGVPPVSCGAAPTVDALLRPWPSSRLPMPARDLYHTAVLRALTVDGWQITDDPLVLSVGSREVYIDLGAEQGPIGAVRGDRRIAVEIKSFVRPSALADLHEAVGQYAVYRSVLRQVDPERELVLAVPLRVHDGILSERIGQLVVDEQQIRVVVFDHVTERIVRWIP